MVEQVAVIRQLADKIPPVELFFLGYEMKYYTYDLHSAQHNKIYIRYTNNLGRRIYFHNKGIQGWTAKYTPCELFYHEEFEKKEVVRKREKELKSHIK